MHYIEIPSSKGTIRIPIIGEVDDPNIADNNKESWSSSGTLVAGNTQRAVQAQANFPIETYYTVQFSVVSPESSEGSGASVVVLAEVTWSNEGNSVTRLISISNGSVISGPGQAVRVRVYDYSLAGLEEVEYPVGISITRGTRPTSGSPPILALNYQAVTPGPVVPARGSVPIYTVVGAGNISLSPPLDAGINSFFFSASFDSVPTTPPVIIESDIVIALVSGAMQVAEFSLAAANTWLPWPSTDMRSLSIFNRNTNNARVTVLFGIEG